MYFAGGDGGSNGTYQYSWTTDSWTRLSYNPLFLDNFAGSDMAYAGGSLYLVGGSLYGILTDTFWVMSTTTPTRGNSWYMVPAPALAPTARSGHSLNIINGYAVMFGGWNTTTYFSGVWAYDISQLTHPGNWVGTTWISVVPDNTTGTLSPPPMNGHSVVNYEDRLVLFGGFSHNPIIPFVNQNECNTNPALQCKFFNDVWVWQPTVPISNTPWSKIAVKGGVAPQARYGHAAALVDGNTMVIFGGTSQGLPMSDLWAYDVSTSTWRALAPSGPAPPAMMVPVGGTMGRHFLVYSSILPNAMFVYYPPDPSNLGPTPGPVKCDASNLAGVNAGLVITILLLIPTLVFAAWSWKLIRGPAGGPKGADAYAAM